MKNNLKYSTLYSATLHNALAYGRLNDNVAHTKVGVYLVVFRIKKIVIDQYIIMYIILIYLLTVYQLYDIKKTTTTEDHVSITFLIDLGVKKDLFKFFSTVFNKGKDEFLQQLRIPTNMYILKDCLFVLRDIHVT